MKNRDGSIWFGNSKDFEDSEKRMQFRPAGRSKRPSKLPDLDGFYCMETYNEFGSCLDDSNPGKTNTCRFLHRLIRFYGILKAGRNITLDEKEKGSDLALMKKLATDCSTIEIRGNANLQNWMRIAFTRLLGYIQNQGLTHTNQLSTLIIEDHLQQVRNEKVIPTIINCVFKEKFNGSRRDVNWGTVVFDHLNYTATENKIAVSHVSLRKYLLIFDYCNYL